MCTETALVEHPVTDEDVETACVLGVGPGWHKMGEVEKDMYRGYFRKFLAAYGAIHREATRDS